jgi:hypothetical protein
MKFSASLLILLFSLLASAQEVEFHGFVDTYHAVRLTDPHDFLSSRSRLRLESTVYFENALGFASADLEHNNVLDDKDPFNLREIYVDFYGEDWDIRIGKQIIIWGKTEGLQVLDVVSPWDFSEFLARDFDDLRVGVQAGRFRYLQDSWTVEIIMLPKFTAAVEAEKDSPWYFNPAANQLGPIYDAIPYEKPEVEFDNLEYGVRFLLYQDWGDLSLVAFRTWDDQKSLLVQSEDSDVGLKFGHQQLTVLGGAFSIPIDSIILRSEIALYKGAKLINNSDRNPINTPHDQLRWVLGLDWTPGDGWTISTQLTDTQILDYRPGISAEEHNRMVTLSLSKTLFRETLTASCFSFIGLEYGDTFTRFSADYSYSDAVHFLAGIDIFTGDEGMLSAFNNNDEAWVKIKYSY